jgi:O-acetyl-ADP-ribose deacetylase (regulator of RNase III)
LANCYRNSLQLAAENRIKTLAFPAISCGAYGYPIREATRIAVATTREFPAIDDKIDKVIFVVAVTKSSALMSGFCSGALPATS